MKTIDQVRQEKKILENQIQNLISEFQKENGITVSGIYVDEKIVSIDIEL